MELFSTAGSHSMVARVNAATEGKSKDPKGKDGLEESSTIAKVNKNKVEKVKSKKNQRQKDNLVEEESEKEEEMKKAGGDVVTHASLSSSSSTFASLGLCSWLQRSTAAMGYVSARQRL